VTTKHT